MKWLVLLRLLLADAIVSVITKLKAQHYLKQSVKNLDALRERQKREERRRMLEEIMRR